MKKNILRFVEIQKNDINGVFGLNFANSVAVSPDGEFLYLTSSDNFVTEEINESAIAVFQRDGLTGKLSFVEAQPEPEDSGSVYSVTISQDGNFLYAAKWQDAAIARFRRDLTTGKLTFLDELQDDEILSGVKALTISPDGQFLYATASDPQQGIDAVTVLQRDPLTGALSFVELVSDDTNNIDGLDGAYSLTLSPDGNYLYVAAIDDQAIAVLRRNSTNGKLSFVEIQTGYTDSIDEPFIPYSLTISPDGKFLYGMGINGVIAVFERNLSTGELRLIELQEEVASDVEAPAGVNTISISFDGQFLYAAVFPDDLVAVFRRDITTGQLTFVEVQADNLQGVDGLDGIFSLATSPNSKFLYTAGFGDSAVTVFRQNSVPISADTNITTQPNSLYSFKADDFPFQDEDSEDQLEEVIIITVPQLGELFLDSNNDQRRNDGELISAGKTIAIATLNQLKFQTNKPAIGNNYTSFQFKVNDGAENSAEVNTLTINVQGTVIINSQNDILTVKNADNQTKAQLQFQLTKYSKNISYELGVYSVDDPQGTINGIAPGTNDYNSAVLSRSQVVLFSIANSPNGFNPLELTRIMEFDSGENLRFYLIPNSTKSEVLSGKTPLSSILLLKQENIQAEDDGFSLNFSDLGVRITTTQPPLPLGVNLQKQPEGEIIDLRSATQPIKAEFIVNREANYDNLVGFYRIVDENGGIDTNGDAKADILVGQPGYQQAAVSGRVKGIDLSVSNQSTAIYHGIFAPGAMFAPFIIVNSRSQMILDENISDRLEIYFPFLGANLDKTDHIRLLGNNTFGFEDLVNSGDRDYNDVILRVNLM